MQKKVIVTNTPVQRTRVIMYSGDESNDSSSVLLCVYGDAAFGSVSTAIAMKKRLGCNFIGIVKSAYWMFPKKQLKFHLANLLARTKLVCWSEIDGVSLLAVGYNYKHGATVNMIMSEGAETTHYSHRPYKQKIYRQVCKCKGTKNSKTRTRK